MKLLGLKKLNKLAKKNKGNITLKKGVKAFITEVEESVWTSQLDLENSDIEFDRVHPDGFYIADINKSNRSMVAITYIQVAEIEKVDNLEIEEEEKEVLKKKLGLTNVLWAGPHDDYDRKFNNKDTIKKWLRKGGHIP